MAKVQCLYKNDFFKGFGSMYLKCLEIEYYLLDVRVEQRFNYAIKMEDNQRLNLLLININLKNLIKGNLQAVKKDNKGGIINLDKLFIHDFDSTFRKFFHTLKDCQNYPDYYIDLTLKISDIYSMYRLIFKVK